MNLLYEKLYDLYEEQLSQETIGFDEDFIKKLLDPIAPDQSARNRLATELTDYCTYWISDAFATGLQMGVRLLSGHGTIQ